MSLGDRKSKGQVLDEFVAVTGLHRKSAMRILQAKSAAPETTGPERRIYGEAVWTVLIMFWAPVR